MNCSKVRTTAPPCSWSVPNAEATSAIRDSYTRLPTPTRSSLIVTTAPVLVKSPSRRYAFSVEVPGRAYPRIAEDLAAIYGTPPRDPLPLDNKRDPLDELIFIMLTVMTEFGVDRVFARLRATYDPWDTLLDAPEHRVRRILQPIGLSTQRARRIRALLAEVVSREGGADLQCLAVLDDSELENYLASLPGVGTKIARCVMLYSFGRPVFPVDAHVLRVLKRLGLAAPTLTLQKAQDVLQQDVPDLLRYTLHVNLVVHGRAVCRARNPLCGECCLRGICPSRAIPTPRTTPRAR